MSWIEPNSGALPVTSYKIEFRHGDLLNYSQSNECSGNDPTVITQTFCTVSIASLTIVPFKINQNQMIQVRVSAENNLGFGIPSSLNSDGILAQVVPHKPTISPQRDSSTNTVQLVVNYPAPIGDLTGGSTITSLHL